MVWVLLDDDGQPVRYFDYAAEGTIEIVEPKLTLDELFKKIENDRDLSDINRYEDYCEKRKQFINEFMIEE